MNGRIKILVFCLLSLVIAACGNKDKTGKLKINFSFSVDGNALKQNQMIYTNAAGNHYEVDEVKYFISDIVFYSSSGRKTYINEKAHYVDADIASTLSWTFAEPMPIGQYDSIRFIFGLSSERNVSNAFVNPPEVNMAWPEVLGGGYHYLQINGKWDGNEGITPFNFHTGISKLTSADSITRFIHNHFYVTLPAKQINVKEKETSTITLDMNLNNWFTNPNDFDFNYWGGSIMENPAAQTAIKQNGRDVFSLK
ncbi:hypothetical protein LJC68_00790 [Bacteroidales bacterium OttesenSCG-928-B11]|nr:hypothetical protein [Bacteroidales bacterium OttesenSCG-928-E04]MDL2311400.1 hypothetical protein [Bacteroidales bacterium OttesenSCG-928-B11]MDL2325796.1 hypothetical protein [Bacteroidales bacterium OttesenSCG-928-A14]